VTVSRVVHLNSLQGFISERGDRTYPRSSSSGEFRVLAPDHFPGLIVTLLMSADTSFLLQRDYRVGKIICFPLNYPPIAPPLLFAFLCTHFFHHLSQGTEDSIPNHRIPDITLVIWKSQNTGQPRCQPLLCLYRTSFLKNHLLDVQGNRCHCRSKSPRMGSR
jgi:hypothetical protein